MTDRLETIILRNLLFTEDYTRKVLPFIKSEYFISDRAEKELYSILNDYVGKFNKLPTKETILIEGSNKKLYDSDYEALAELLDSLEPNPDDKNIQEWLIQESERFCQNKSIELAVLSAAQILNGSEKKLQIGEIPKLLEEALAVSFDKHVGHDYIEDAEKRFEYYHNKEAKLPFHLQKFNEMTNGGLPGKSLTVFVAGVHVGKTALMCDLAANYLTTGKNVLYITLEMSEEMISERIDANLLDIPIDDIRMVSPGVLNSKISKLKLKTLGSLIIKEFPTGAAHAGHFRHLLHELKLKKNFVPHVIIVDYINICNSSRIKRNSDGIGGYYFIKSICEELRGWSIETNIPIISATQLTRGGYDDSDPTMTDVGESFALGATVDCLPILIATDELIKLNQVCVKQEKNRFGDKTKNTRFVIGFDRQKMRFYDVEKSAQTLSNDTDRPEELDDEQEERIQISEKKGSFGYKPGYPGLSKSKERKKDFSSFKL